MSQSERPVPLSIADGTLTGLSTGTVSTPRYKTWYLPP
jgi:hypothetical protein